MQVDIYRKIEELRELKQPFAVATVISVRGSTSAKPGSKAIINSDGKNILGWVGGGCAESFAARNAVEAMESGQPRIIEADLDDEIFGLGMPCGGKMDIYIEPVLPPDPLRLPVAADLAPLLRHLAEYLSFEPVFDAAPSVFEGAAISPAERAFLVLAEAILAKRNLPWDSLRRARGVLDAPNTVVYDGVPREFSELILLGSGRIPEEMAKLAARLSWPTRLFTLSSDTTLYPPVTEIHKIVAYEDGIDFTKHAFVLIAAHHKGDPEFIERAMSLSASYIGLVASPKRSRLVFEHLMAQGQTERALQTVFAPSGVVMHCRNPSEIALSVLVEMILLRRGLRGE
jgi:xanthine/CO dehydrogenase XdhC/CoxF family maturation factor